jgi:methionyl aminopeptidase
MIIIKNEEQIAALRITGDLHAELLDQIEQAIKPGMSTYELDQYAHRLVTEAGAIPAFLNYQPDSSYPKFPASLCVSINDVIVHGIPNKDTIINNGDLVSIDLGVIYKGVVTDSARTVIVGEVTETKKQLVYDTREALYRGIEAARFGNTVGDIGHAIESFNNKQYGNVRELAGHGVGLEVHEEPYVPNYGKPGSGPRLKPGMVLAIEPMFNLGSSEVIFHNDGYTVSTKDAQVSAHVEHTILITEGEAEILTEKK